jgi:hypothetical protein
MAQGASACPRRSHFGDGSADFVSGFGRPDRVRRPGHLHGRWRGEPRDRA